MRTFEDFIARILMPLAIVAVIFTVIVGVWVLIYVVLAGALS